MPLTKIGPIDQESGHRGNVCSGFTENVIYRIYIILSTLSEQQEYL